jgi:hypothetical protein
MKAGSSGFGFKGSFFPQNLYFAGWKIGKSWSKS